MVKVLYPTTRVEEYEFRAKYLKDEYHMSGDGPRSTEFRINKILGLVPFDCKDKVLDISPGKGLLFERISGKVSECCGIDVTPAMLEGKWMVRVSVGALPTERSDVERLWATIRRLAEAHLPGR